MNKTLFTIVVATFTTLMLAISFIPTVYAQGPNGEASCWPFSEGETNFFADTLGGQSLVTWNGSDLEPMDGYISENAIQVGEYPSIKELPTEQDDFAYAGWFHWDGSSDDFYALISGNTSVGLAKAKESSPHYHALRYAVSNGSSFHEVYSEPIDKAGWYFLGLVYDRTGERMALYLAHQEQSELQVYEMTGIELPEVDTDEDTILYTAGVDELRYWDELSSIDEQIEAVYNGKLTCPSPSYTTFLPTVLK